MYPSIGERVFTILYLLSLEYSKLFQISRDFTADLQVLPRKEVQVEEGPLPVLKWDQGLFERITRGFRFPPEWDAQYPRQGHTAADAPPGCITLFEDFFLQGNFCLPATEFMASILHFYGFYISQMSPAGMVQVRHFEFLCRSQGQEPTVEKF
ncbi:hypothetical protein Hanom_Chr02g00128791 [Helianthus anomalus]